MGRADGELLSAAEAASFDILLTADKTLHHEQNMSGRKIALISLSAVSWPVIEPHVAKIADAVDNAKPGSFTRVECGAFVRPRRLPKGPLFDNAIYFVEVTSFRAEFLANTNEISQRSAADDTFRKVLMISAASYFEPS